MKFSREIFVKKITARNTLNFRVIVYRMKNYLYKTYPKLSRTQAILGYSFMFCPQHMYLQVNFMDGCIFPIEPAYYSN